MEQKAEKRADGPEENSLQKTRAELGPSVVDQRLVNAVHQCLTTGESQPDLEWLLPFSERSLLRANEELVGQPKVLSALVEQVTAMVSETLKFFREAPKVLLESRKVTGSGLTFASRLGSSECLISSSDVSRLMDWGRVPTSDDPQGCDVLELEICEKIQRELQRIILGMKEIGTSEAFRIEPRMDVASWFSSLSGDPLELFVRDVLTDQGFATKRATLFEDVLEGTDLRIQLPGVKRNRGVRMQVSWIANQAAFRKKRFLLPYAPTIIFVCPFTLAQSWNWRDGGDFTAGYLESDQKVLDEAHAVEIQRKISVILKDSSHLLGPAKEAPDAILKLIREFVEIQGPKCNAVLRERQVLKPSYGSLAEYSRSRLLEDIRNYQELKGTLVEE